MLDTGVPPPKTGLAKQRRRLKSTVASEGLCKPTAGDTGKESLRNTFGKFLRILLTELKEQTGRMQAASWCRGGEKSRCDGSLVTRPHTDRNSISVQGPWGPSAHTGLMTALSQGQGGLWKRSPVLWAGMIHCSSVVLRRTDNRSHQLPGA